MNRIKIGVFFTALLLILGLSACATGDQTKGYVTGVSVANRTVTVDGQLIHVPKNISMTKGGTPVALQDIMIGNRVSVRTEKASDGSVQAKAILLLGVERGKK